MPWKKAKALPPPDNALFEACSDSARGSGRRCGQADSAGRGERLRSAEVGRSSSLALRELLPLGRCPALMPITKRATVGGFRFDGSGGSFQTASVNDGGSWFAVAHNTTSGHGQNPDGRKVNHRIYKRDGARHTPRLTNPAEHDIERVSFGSSRVQRARPPPRTLRRFHWSWRGTSPARGIRGSRRI